LILDIVLDRAAAIGEIARSKSHLFFRSAGPDVVDPRRLQLGPDALPARFDNPERERELAAWFADRLIRLLQAGAAGVRLVGLADVPPEFLSVLIAGVRRVRADCRFLGWTPGLSWSSLARLEATGLDAVFASTPWWNRRAGWFVDEHNLLRRIAPQ